eukprot:scaffold2014_cov213-Chaetoceros_neogracile.AAC.9
MEPNKSPPARSERARRRIKPSRMNHLDSTPKKRKGKTTPDISVVDCSIGASDVVSMTLKGKPSSWIRASPRTGQGGRTWMFNPNIDEQTSVRDAILASLKQEDGTIRRPIFGPNVPVYVNMTFLLPRPASHFIIKGDESRCAGNIKPKYRTKFSTVTPDIDNLLKFHLDTPFKGLLLHDDRQVTAVLVRKLYDVLGDSKGHTEIRLQKDSWISKYIVT